MPEDMLQYLGAFIRKSRKDCELTQDELAEQSGVSAPPNTKNRERTNKSIL